MKTAAEKIVQRHISNDSTKSPETLPDDKQQMIDTLLANAKKIDEFLATNEPRMGKGKNPKEVQSNITDNEKFVWNEFSCNPEGEYQDDTNNLPYEYQ